MSLGATMQGVILGTAAYMSPEQARGANADRRADVWAFGVVLFEMLSGRTLFAGPTVSDTLASVLKVEPDLAQLPPATPPRIRRLLERCLRKDAQQRLHSIADARIMIEEVQRGEVDEPGAGSGLAAAAPRPRWQVAAALAAAALAGGALFALVARLGTPAPAPVRVVRFDLPQPEGLVVVGAPKVSPDGRHIAFDGRDKAGKVQLWLRSLDEATARPVAGTENAKTAGRPFWSPDSRYLAFFTADKLIKIPIEGGPAQKICDADGADGSWSDQDLILFDGTAAAPLMGVPASGGRQAGHRLPRTTRAQPVRLAAVPARRALPLRRRRRWRRAGRHSDGECRRQRPPAGWCPGLSRGEYVPPGWLLFVRESTLVAQRFDPADGKISGEPIPVADGLTVSNVGLAEFSTSRDGVLAFRTSGATADQLAYFDRRGNRDATAVESGLVGHPVFSPDGRWIAFDKRVDGGKADIWVRDLRRGVSSRFTTAPENDFAPLFSPDGERLVFVRETEGGKSSLFVRPLAVGGETELHTAEGLMAPLAISPDGRRLVFAKIVGGTYDLFALDFDGDRRAARSRVSPITQTPAFSEFRADLSPDGAGWPCSRTNPARSRSTFSPFPAPGAAGSCRPPAASSRSGAAGETRSSFATLRASSPGSPSPSERPSTPASRRCSFRSPSASATRCARSPSPRMASASSSRSRLPRSASRRQ